MSALSGVLLQEFIMFKRKFWTTTTGAMISPILYLIAFGWGLGGGMKIEGRDYINFVIPGILALNTMIVSFSNTGNSINTSRIYYKTFEEFMVAPINMAVYALGKVIAGALYGLYSGTLIILLVSLFSSGLVITPYFILLVILNCFVFSAIGFLVGLLINSHGDMAKFTSFIITPMSFLCGTFFPINKMPIAIQGFIQILPLTHTSIGLRSVGEDPLHRLLHPLILASYLIVVFIAGVRVCKNVDQN